MDKQEKAAKPSKPDASLLSLRSHRVTAHRDRFFLADYGREECERLKAAYAESMAYWIDNPST